MERGHPRGIILEPPPKTTTFHLQLQQVRLQHLGHIPTVIRIIHLKWTKFLCLSFCSLFSEEYKVQINLVRIPNTGRYGALCILFLYILILSIHSYKINMSYCLTSNFTYFNRFPSEAAGTVEYRKLESRLHQEPSSGL